MPERPKFNAREAEMSNVNDEESREYAPPVAAHTEPGSRIYQAQLELDLPSKSKPMTTMGC